MAITALPSPPIRSDSQVDFSATADTFLAALPVFATEVNATQAQINAGLAALTAGGSPMFPVVTSANAGQSLVVNAAGTAYEADNNNNSIGNGLRNGDFKIWQRGTSFTPASLATMYCADMWHCFRAIFTAGLTVSKQDNGTFNSMRIQRDSGNTSTTFIQAGKTFESQDVKRWAGKTITLQLKIKKGANYTDANSYLPIFVQYGTGTDGNLAIGLTGGINIVNAVAVVSTSFSLASFTFTLPSNASQLAIVAYYVPKGAAGANDYFEIADVQFDEGAVAKPFRGNVYGLELMLCRRNYQEISSLLTGGYNTAGGHVYTTYPLSIPMRASPTIGFGSLSYVNSSGLVSWISANDRVVLDLTIISTGYGFVQHGLKLDAEL